MKYLTAALFLVASYYVVPMAWRGSAGTDIHMNLGHLGRVITTAPAFILAYALAIIPGAIIQKMSRQKDSRPV